MDLWVHKKTGKKKNTTDDCGAGDDDFVERKMRHLQVCGQNYYHHRGYL